MIRVRMLGQVDVASENGNAAITSLLDHPKRLALLVFLARKPDQMRQRDELTLLFWPDRDDQHARNALRQAIHVLRTAAGEEAFVTRRGGGVGVDPDLVTSDTADFERAVLSGAHEEALALYGGDFLNGFYISDEPGFERWADDERERLRRLAFSCAERLARRLERNGRRDLAVDSYRRALELSPHNGPVVRRLMWLLGQLGNPAEALEEYTAFARRLESDLGLRPCEDTRRMAHEVLGGDPTPDGRLSRDGPSASASP